MWNVNLLMSSYSWMFVNTYFWRYEINSPISSKLWILKYIAKLFPSVYIQWIDAFQEILDIE